MSRPVAAAVRPQRQTPCGRCGALFACGPGTGAEPGACWCMALPPLAILQDGADCLCPACLKAALDNFGSDP